MITGLSPGVVASIIDSNLDIDGLTTAMNLEDALEILTQSTEPETDDENDAGNVENNDTFEKEPEKGLDNKES